mmetsp:Transcript_162144/g.393875  ORF Transcript_162144/g.393875 Transcript_162144/m.393875 type:complete len:442 (+) Transcript_162144:3-1328(+)
MPNGSCFGALRAHARAIRARVMGGLCPTLAPASEDSGNLKARMDSASGRSMKVGGGLEMLRNRYLAGFKDAHRSTYPTIPMLEESAGPTIDGTIDDVAKAHPELVPVLYNDVKVCTSCSKPCAFTLTVCNACGTSLEGVPVGKSENVFSAFLLGVSKAAKGFPYKISLRRLTDDVLVMDDLLALSTCHFNCIPRKHYIPDWRFLLCAPQQALELLDVMEAECWTAMQPFLQNEDYRKSIFRGNVSDEELRKRVITTFNFPPSQFQLHIQWIVPPMMPFQHYMAEIRNHLHEGRSFPMAYVRKVLSLNEPFQVTHSTPISEIIDFYDKKGVNYQAMWEAFYEESLQATMDLQNWRVDDFRYVVDDSKVHEISVVDGRVELGAEVPELNAKAIQEQDKAALQNYGRPYSDDDRVTGTYLQRTLEPKIGPGGYGQWPGVDLSGG